MPAARNALIRVAAARYLYAAMPECSTRRGRPPRLERGARATDDSVMRTGASATADCPLAPPARETTYIRALHHACVVLGGVAQLASHLQASEYAVNTWLEGREEP